jgi:hypothetical protein
MGANGKKRIVMHVAAHGTTPSLDFLDANGHIVKRVFPGN